MNTKYLSLVLALGATVFLGGCESVGEPLAERFRPAPVKQIFEAPEAKVFEAAVAALREMGYTIRRASARSGEIEAYGRLMIEDSFRSANQHNCRATIIALPDGSTDVLFEVREQVEERTGAGLMRQSEQVLPMGGIHQRFFDEVRSRL